MPRTLIKSRMYYNEHRPKIKQELNNTNTILPPSLQCFKQKLLPGSGFVE